YLIEVLETRHPRSTLVSALAATTVIVRGPKPLKVVRELGIDKALAAPEPNTWRELLTFLDDRRGGFDLSGKSVAVQEYGARNQDFLAALRERGAVVTPVPVYRWELPDDLQPLREAIQAVAADPSPVLLFTSAT